MQHVSIGMLFTRTAEHLILFSTFKPDLHVLSVDVTSRGVIGCEQPPLDFGVSRITEVSVHT